MTIASAVKVDGRRARGEATRKALLNAAIACLIDAGWSGTTTAKISERAGVSQGLFARYWPSKTALIADAAALAQQRGFARLGERYRQATAAGEDGRLVAIPLLFKAFDEPEMRVLAELQMAAATNGELRRALNDAILDTYQVVLDGARAMAPPGAVTDDFEQRFLAMIDMARGLSLRTKQMSSRLAAQAREQTVAVVTDVFGIAA